MPLLINYICWGHYVILCVKSSEIEARYFTLLFIYAPTSFWAVIMFVSTRYIMGYKFSTRMHSSRMHTARSLTVCRGRSICMGGVHVTHTPLPRMPPATHTPLDMHAPGHVRPPCEQNHTPLADLRGGARDAPPPPRGSKFFHFHAVFGEKIEK